MKKIFHMAAIFVSCSALTMGEKMAFAHPKKRTPQVQSVNVKDQVGQTADGPYSTINPWLSGHLGLVGPGQYVWSDRFARGFYKKVEVKFQLVSASSDFAFKMKQQKKGTVKYNGQIAVFEGKPASWPDWVQDGPYRYPNSTNVVDSQRLFLWDTPGISSGSVGSGSAESYVYDMHFRDKVKWNSPKGEKDVFRDGDPDPYFGYWARYVAIWTNPAAPPNGTNNQWTGADGNR